MNPNKKYIFILVIVALIGAVVWVVIFKSTYAKINQTKSTQAVLSNRENKIQQFSTIEKELSGRNISLDDLLVILPNNNNFLQFITFIENAASTNSNSVTIDFGSKSNFVKSQPNTKVTQENKIGFTLEVNGTVSNLLKTINQIENGKYFINITKINYIARSDDGSLATVKIIGEVYVKKGFEK